MERGEGEKGGSKRLKIKMRKSLLTELVALGYLFIGLLKWTLEQSALQSS